MDFSLSNSLVGSATLNPDKLSLDLQFATDKSLTARKGPTPVFTRASGATQVNAAGLIEYAPENLYFPSELLTTSPTNVTLARVTGDSVIASPVFMAETSATGLHRVFSNNVTADGLTICSYIIKEAGRDFVFFNGTSGHPSNTFNLSSGAFTNNTGWSAISLGSGWWRIITPVFTPSGASGVAIQINTTSAVFDSSYAGDITKGILIGGIQRERSSTARTYIPTTTAAVYGARFDHDPSTLVSKGLLIEESRTNLITQSANISAWSGGFTNNGSTTAPDGTSSGYSAVIGFAACQSPITANVTGLHTASCFLKRNNTDWMRIRIIQGANLNIVTAWVNLATGAVGTVSATAGTPTSLSATIISYGNGWYRCSVTASYPATSYLYISLASATGDGIALGVAGSIYEVWGGQIEAGSFPTSYIPTTTASVVRSADVCSITGSAFTGMYNQSEGTINMSASTMLAGNAYILFAFSDGTTNNFMQALPGTSSFIVNTLGVTQASLNTGSFTNNVVSRVASAFKLNDFASSRNGGTVSTDNAGTLPTVNQLGIGSRISAVQLNGHIEYIRHYKKRLANAKLVTLTT